MADNRYRLLDCPENQKVAEYRLPIPTDPVRNSPGNIGS